MKCLVAQLHRDPVKLTSSKGTVVVVDSQREKTISKITNRF